MDKEELKHLNEVELALISQLGEILSWGSPKCNLLPFTI